MRSRFPDMAVRAFSFLEEYGLRTTERDDGEVLYESDRSFVQIMWDRRSGELEAFLGAAPYPGASRDGYSLCSILRFVGAAGPDCRPAQVADEQRLGPFVEALARNVRVHARPAVLGDQEFFVCLHAHQRAASEAYWLKMRLDQIRGQVGAAWHKREYVEVVRLYGSVEAHLTEAKRRKLAYARQYL